MTKISVIIPTRDRPKLVLRALASAVLGTPRGAEIIVVDDGIKYPFSLDPTLVGAGGKEVRVVKTRGAEGPGAARNIGVAASSNALIFFLDDDDELVGDYTENIIELLDNNTDLMWGYSSTIDIFGGVSQPFNLQTKRHKTNTLLGVETKLQEYICGLGSGFWIKRECYNGVGGISLNQKMDEDTDLCCRLFARSILGYYSKRAGVKIHRAWVEHGEDAQLTVSASPEDGAGAYLLTFKNNAARLQHKYRALIFLAQRCLRAAAKAQNNDEMHYYSKVSAEISQTWIRVYLWLYWQMKLLALRVKTMKKTL